MEQAVRSKTLSTRAKSYDNIHNTLTVSCEKSKMFSFTSSIMKNLTQLFAPLRFPVKLICCVAFGSASIACCLLKSIGIMFYDIIVI